MNHLAHVVLAGPSEGLRIGAFLGDHVKGRRALEALPPDWAAGVMLHRRIDATCDAHPAVAALLERLRSPWRRYGGVMLDVLFDHMLTRHWARFGPADLHLLGRQIDELLDRHRHKLPPRLVRFSRWAGERRLWRRYGEREMLEEIFELLARRHGRHWPLAHGARLLDEHEQAIERGFLELFPDLQRRADAERVRLQSIWSSM